MLTVDDIAKLSQVFATKEDLREALLEQDERWNGKHQEVLSRIDAVFKELKDMREEKVIHQLQHERIDEDLEKMKKIPAIAHELKVSDR